MDRMVPDPRTFKELVEAEGHQDMGDAWFVYVIKECPAHQVLNHPANLREMQNRLAEYLNNAKKAGLMS